MPEIIPLSGIPTELDAAIRHAEKLLGFRLTVHNVTGILKTPDGMHLLPLDRGLHEQPLCRLCKKAALSRCLHDCQQYANEHSRTVGTPWLHTCWAGLTELVTPVQRGGAYSFTVFTGVFRTPDAERPSRSPVSVAAFRALPVPSERELASVSALVATLAQGILSRAEALNRLEGGDGGRKDRIRRFMYFHARDKISLRDLAAHLNLSNDRTSHLVTDLFGMPFRKLLLQERLKNARAILLSSPDWNVGLVARSVGIRDEYYFNRAFKEMFGVPPGRYRKDHLKKLP